MSYQNLTAKQIYLEEVVYTLDDFASDFKMKLIGDWGEKRINQRSKFGLSVYSAIFVMVVFNSQHKPLKFITKIVLGTVNEETLKLTKGISEMYKKEAEILEGLQIKMFLENLKKYHLSDSLNLKLLNENFKVWMKKALK